MDVLDLAQIRNSIIKHQGYGALPACLHSIVKCLTNSFMVFVKPIHFYCVDISQEVNSPKFHSKLLSAVKNFSQS